MHHLDEEDSLFNIERGLKSLYLLLLSADTRSSSSPFAVPPMLLVPRKTSGGGSYPKARHLCTIRGLDRRVEGLRTPRRTKH